MNDLEFSAKIHQKSREVCKAHDHGAGNAVQCDVHSIFAAETIRNKQASALDGALDKAQNEVDSEAEDDI